MPGAFGLLFGEVAVEDDPAIAESVRAAGVEDPVSVFGRGVVGEEVAAAVRGIRPDSQRFGVIEIVRMGKHGDATVIIAESALDDAPAGFAVIGVAAIHSFGGEDFAVVAVPFGGGAPAEAAVAIGEESDGVKGDGSKLDRDVEQIVGGVPRENRYSQMIVEKDLPRTVLVNGDVLLKGFKFLGA